MAQIHRFNQKVNLNEESIGNYYVNLYKDGKFVEGRHYEMYSGNAMMEEVSFLKLSGYTVEW